MNKEFSTSSNSFFINFYFKSVLTFLCSSSSFIFLFLFPSKQTFYSASSFAQILFRNFFFSLLQNIVLLSIRISVIKFS
ncbi:hypothetical protein O3M35_012312 [Rhynocoris fuscipes]|uniref:Uncharacterized protein n=1 Tax=Rhynocoris fuscipes TaxID=488301 RepID=A0AAW1CXN9_9HEMI